MPLKFANSLSLPSIVKKVCTGSKRSQTQRCQAKVKGVNNPTWITQYFAEYCILKIKAVGQFIVGFLACCGDDDVGLNVPRCQADIFETNFLWWKEAGVYVPGKVHVRHFLDLLCTATEFKGELNQICKLSWKHRECVFSSSFGCSAHITLILSFSGTAMLICSLPMKSKKRMAHDIFNSFATHYGLVFLCYWYRLPGTNIDQKETG